MSRRLAALLLTALLAVFILAGLVSLPLPFTRDQGIYAYNAWMWLADNVPYRDTFGHKGPLLYALYAVALDISGGAAWGVNLADLAARALTVILCFCLANSVAGRRTGLYAAALAALPLFGVFNSCWWNGQAETFMMPLLAASAWAVASLPERAGAAGKRGVFMIFAAGFLAAQAVALKLNAFVHAGFLLVWVAGAGDYRRRGMAALTAGLAAGLLPWALYFAAKGALYEAWEFLVLFNSYHAQAGFEGAGLSRVALFMKRAWTVFGLIPVLMAFMLLPGKGERGREGASFAAAWVLAALVQTSVQTTFFLYHYLALVPAVAVAGGMGLSRLHELRLKRLPRAGAAAALAILLLLFAGHLRSWALIHRSYRTFDHLSGEITLAEFYARFSDEDREGKGDFNLLASAAAAHYIRQRVPRGRTALVFGYEPLVNYLSARPAPVRFQIDYPLTFRPLSKSAALRREMWREQFMSELKASPPALVALVDNDINAIEPETSLDQAMEFVEFRDWLKGNYRQTERIEDFIFFERIF